MAGYQPIGEIKSSLLLWLLDIAYIDELTNASEPYDFKLLQ